MDIGTMSIIGILIGVVVLIFCSYKGVPPIFVAVLSSLIVLIFSGQNVLTGIFTTYMGGFGAFASRYFLTFITGSIYGAIMGDSGAAKSLAMKFSRLAKRSKNNAKLFTVLAIVAISTILAYGGISAFVAMFTIIAVAKELYREMDVPWGLYGCQILGSGCIAMSMLPGSPSIPNVIAADKLGTTPTSAPVIGILSALFALCLGIIYIRWEIKRAEKKNEGFEPTGTEIAKTIEPDEDFNEMNIIMCLIPSIVLVVLYNVLAPVQMFKDAGASAIVTATLVGVIVAYALYWGRIKDKMATAKTGLAVAVNSVCVASMVVAFGTVVQASPGFEKIIVLLDRVPGPPVVQLIISVNIAAGVTGSASGGLTIALNALGDRFLNMGMNPAIVHRIACISCGGLDSLPHNGSIINELNIAKLNHKTGYRPMGVCSVVIPIITVIFAAVLSQFGIV